MTTQMRLCQIASAAALALLIALPAQAAEEEFQMWGAATATVPLDEKTVLWLEGQTRFHDSGDRLGQLLLRSGVGRKLGATETVFLGYAYVATNPATGPTTHEHRIWQQLSFRAAGDGQGVTLTGRSRLEQRFLNGSNDMGFRFRQLLRVTAPLSGKLRAVGWAELFVALDDTNWGQRSGFDRLRSFAGIAVPLNRTLSLEPGYMHERIRLPARDQANHIASVTINASF